MTDSVAYKIPEVKECAGYEKLGSTEIRLEVLDAFIECAEYYKIEKIWSCYAPLCNKFKYADRTSPDFERIKPFPLIFFFATNNVIYSAESQGYNLLHDYMAAKEKYQGKWFYSFKIGRRSICILEFIAKWCIA